MLLPVENTKRGTWLSSTYRMDFRILKPRIMGLNPPDSSFSAFLFFLYISYYKILKSLSVVELDLSHWVKGRT
jgi:hypothetical protein